MRLSPLQKYIMIETYQSRGPVVSRKRFEKFYNSQKNQPKDVMNVLTKSIERLIDRELMIGSGTRTPHKWYIKEVKLTPKGRRIAKKLLGEQQPLPFRQARKRAKSHAKNRKRA